MALTVFEFEDLIVVNDVPEGDLVLIWAQKEVQIRLREVCLVCFGLEVGLGYPRPLFWAR